MRARRWQKSRGKDAGCNAGRRYTGKRRRELVDVVVHAVELRSFKLQRRGEGGTYSICFRLSKAYVACEKLKNAREINT